MDLDQEFAKLVEEMRQSVRDKLANGELSKADAATLQDMITDRVYDAWNSSNCYSDSDYNDDGWQPSMVC
jgi:hypothetical protein